MKIKVFYRRNIKMSDGKLASQVAHAVKNLGYTPIDCDIAVLKASDKKFDEIKEMCISENKPYYVQIDKGITEVEAGTETTIAYIDNFDAEKLLSDIFADKINIDSIKYESKLLSDTWTKIKDSKLQKELYDMVKDYDSRLPTKNDYLEIAKPIDCSKNKTTKIYSNRGDININL